MTREGSSTGASSSRADREEERLGVAETTGEDAMYHNVFGRTQVVVNSEGKGVARGVGVQGGTSKAIRRDQTFHGAGRDDGGTDFRCVEAMKWDKTNLCRGGDAKDTMTGRSVTMTVGRDETSAARVTRSIWSIGMEVAGGVCGGCLCTTIHMGPRTIKVVMEDGINLHRSGFRVGKDLLE
jgi:hypothetical protein